jgi:hypothetical protein
MAQAKNQWRPLENIVMDPTVSPFSLADILNKDFDTWSLLIS